MKYLNFNSNNSLTKEKLIFDESILMKILDFFQNISITIAPIILGLGFFYLQLKIQNPVLFPVSIIALLISIFLAIFIFFQIRKSINFRKFIVKENRIVNRQMVEEMCENNNWKILHNDNQSHVIMVENYKILNHHGIELYIVYHNNFIYLRALTYAMYDYINPFNWITQKKIENKIIKKLSTTRYIKNC
ncbi:hypothetical protein F6U93_01850 [Tamlana haliotis]|uniref:Uncharacterized protein n=1 Tax=Pseudotamlana haliotis TaxID=2614804 RepID=A0A6N6ML53_9FLAO|nr:hypothetical protein [Tamlana haliotis]KAB1070438.1 hypothetical protein F6U93_01850 [Tamlana haliotis]